MQDFTTLTNQAQRGPAAFYKNGDYIEIKEQDKMNRINEQDKEGQWRIIWKKQFCYGVLLVHGY